MLRIPNTPSKEPGSTPDTKEMDEVRLIDRITHGERSAFNELFRAYYPRLTRFLERMTRRPTLVEEILNDTMLVVWNKAHTYDHTCKVSTWIFAIAYRKAAKALKALDEPIDFAIEQCESVPERQPEQAVMQQQLQLILSNALSKLSPRQRAVMELTYRHNIGYREIADIMDCPVDTVKTRMFQARRRLRTLLANLSEDWQ